MVRAYQNGYITPAFSGTHCGERRIWRHHPRLLGVPMVGNYPYGYITASFSGSPWWGDSNMAISLLPSRPHRKEDSKMLVEPSVNIESLASFIFVFWRASRALFVRRLCVSFLLEVGCMHYSFGVGLAKKFFESCALSFFGVGRMHFFFLFVELKKV